MKALMVIPARQGSRRLKDKNIRFLGTKPLIWWSMETAVEAAILLKESNIESKIIVSTDSPEYQRIANDFGKLEQWLSGKRLQAAPFLRPAEISKDVDTGLVCRHAWEYARDEMSFEADWVITLQPTSPFRDYDNIVYMLHIAVNSADKPNLTYPCVFSVKPVTEFPRWMFTVKDHEEGLKSMNYPTWKDFAKPAFKQREDVSLSGDIAQDQPKLYIPNGSVYITRKDIIQQGRIYGDYNGAYIMEEPWKNVDIEEEIDFRWAEFLLKEGYVK